MCSRPTPPRAPPSRSGDRYDPSDPPNAPELGSAPLPTPCDRLRLVIEGMPRSSFDPPGARTYRGGSIHLSALATVSQARSVSQQPHAESVPQPTPCARSQSTAGHRPHTPLLARSTRIKRGSRPDRTPPTPHPLACFSTGAGSPVFTGAHIREGHTLPGALATRGGTGCRGPRGVPRTDTQLPAWQSPKLRMRTCRAPDHTLTMGADARARPGWGREPRPGCRGSRE